MFFATVKKDLQIFLIIFFCDLLDLKIFFSQNVIDSRLRISSIIIFLNKTDKLFFSTYKKSNCFCNCKNSGMPSDYFRFRHLLGCWARKKIESFFAWHIIFYIGELSIINLWHFFNGFLVY